MLYFLIAQQNKNTSQSSNEITNALHTRKLVIKKSKYKYFPQTREELRNIIKQRIEQEGNEADLNDIDVSNITDMSYLFLNQQFNCDISKWDVSNVIDMSSMFNGCESFNKDISNWNVSNVKDMSRMFYGCLKFNSDISNWDVSNVKDNKQIFTNCKIEEKYKPKFK